MVKTTLLTSLRAVFLFLFFLIISSNVSADKGDSEMLRRLHDIDSLKNELNKRQHTEKERLEIIEHISGGYCTFEMDSTLCYAHKAIPLARKLKEYTYLNVLYDQASTAHCFKSNYDSALVYSDLRKALAVERGYRDVEAASISTMAFTYAKQGKYNTAIDYYLRALKIAENEGLSEECVKVLMNLSEIYRRLGNTETALKYLEKAEKMCTIESVLNYSWRISYIWNEFSFNYLNENDLDMALKYALKSDSINQGGYIVNSCYTNGLLATIYLRKNDSENALQYALKSYKNAQTLNDKNLYAYSGKILSDVYLAQKRYPEAEAAALKVWEVDSTDLDESRDIAKNIVLANIFMGKMDRAAYFLRKYSELNTQYSEKSFQNTVADLSIQYETEKKELRIAALEEKAKLYVGLSILGASFLLLLIVAFYFRQKNTAQKRKLSEQQRELAEQKVKQLEQEKQLVATQAVLDGETAERSRLARDLHDGLGGMLSVVKLNLKDMKPFAILEGGDMEQFGKALDMLDQSINELRRVAHHIMPDSLVRYGLKVALEDFCHAIPGTRFQFLGENPRLDNRLEVLIYRCAYELINNAVKHAQATAISVQLMVDDGIVSLTVQDNGIGFDPKTVSSGIGLENIKTRLAVYNGKMNIHSSPENGTEICIEIEQPL